jgi:hypothetical protein
MKNNQTSTGEEDYFNNFNFLQQDDTQNKIEQNVNKNSTHKSNFRPKNAITLDEASSSEKQVDLHKAAHAVLTEETNQSENMFMIKSAIQQSLESPELNKKLRAQQEYNQIMANKDNPEKKISKKNDINNIIHQEDFDVSKFKDEQVRKHEIKEEIIKIIPVEENINTGISEDKRQKVYKIKKKKQILPEENSNLENNQNQKINLESKTIQQETSTSRNIDKKFNLLRFNFMIPLVFTSTIFLGVLYRKKIINFFKLKK